MQIPFLSMKSPHLPVSFLSFSESESTLPLRFESPGEGEENFPVLEGIWF
jgi:hypothetical protein